MSAWDLKGPGGKFFKGPLKNTLLTFFFLIAFTVVKKVQMLRLTISIFIQYITIKCNMYKNNKNFITEILNRTRLLYCTIYISNLFNKFDELAT